MNKITQVLFVCLGNTARSPAAEYLARYYARELHLDLKFDSCGFINAFHYMQPESRKYLEAKGIEHSDFVPKLLNRKLLERQDLVLTMEKSHSKEIISNYHNIKDINNKVFTLKEFNGEKNNLNIVDPYYTSDETYRNVLKIIDENVEKAIKKIKKLNES
ncbi:MAG: low molecular weight protein arginine phosphatase [Promethearchaeota archaeon]|nr:MAG: low molecular weight protein arginine phosphatase [Candidatus Lokiarchaeota archaeon]